MAGLLDSIGGVASGLIKGGSLSGALVEHCTVDITLDGMNVNWMFPPMELLTIRYEDNISFQADNLEICFPDVKDYIIKSKSVYKGMIMGITIHQWNHDYPGSHTARILGGFSVDQIKQAGPPTVTTLMATSVPLHSQIKLTLQNKTVYAISLKQLHSSIAKKYGLTPVWDVPDGRDRPVGTISQYNESDLQMLAKQLKGAGLSMKIADEKLIVFDIQEYEKKPPVYTFDFANPSAWGLVHWVLTSQSQDIYSTARIDFYNSDTGETTVGTAEHPDGTDTTGTTEELREYGAPPYSKDAATTEGGD